jgi:hypothetical protein
MDQINESGDPEQCRAVKKELIKNLFIGRDQLLKRGRKRSLKLTDKMRGEDTTITLKFMADDGFT